MHDSLSCHLRIATRKSPLALYQSQRLQTALLNRHSHLTSELCPFITEGDQKLDSSLAKIGGKGLFIKALEQAMLMGKADLAVHSLKDMPAQLPAGFEMRTVFARDAVHDALLSKQFSSFAALPEGAIVGTSSQRRQAQLAHWRPDLVIKPLRGNVNSRIQKLEEQCYDAIVLAQAGLERLNLQHHIREILPLSRMLPAIGQGALCVEFRSDDHRVKALVASLCNRDTEICATVERLVADKLNADCHSPVAAMAVIKGQRLQLQALVGSLDGKVLLRSERDADRTATQSLSEQVVADLYAQGAESLLADNDG